MITRSKKKDFLISATRLTNYIKRDCIIDYLDIVSKNNFIINEDLVLNKKRKLEEIDNNDNNKNKKTTFEYITESGYCFEEMIIKQIINKMTIKKEIKNLIKIEEKNIDNNFVITKKTLLEKKHDIILGGILINKSNNTFGYPDLIVSGNWINNYIKDCPKDIPNNRSRYYIIDIKSSTINLRSGGAYISSKLLYNCYKYQIYIYTTALNKIFEENGIINNVEYGFVLGKKYQFIQNKNMIYLKSFDKLGVINFSIENQLGFNFENITKNALEWHKDLNNNWENYSLNPINKDELYPNMKNNYDKTYHKIKKDIALKNKEITLLWNCGIKQRDLAWENGIKKYDDPKLNCEILKMENTSKENIVSSMLKMIHSESLILINKENNYMNWQKVEEYEFYIDFETYNKDAIFDENSLSEFNTNIDNEVIYMIGVGFSKDDKFKSKTFIIQYNDYENIEKNFHEKKKNCNLETYVFCENEKELITNFVEYLYGFKPKNLSLENYIKKMRLYHWSQAEPCLYNKKINEHILINKKYNLPWFDLLKVFKYNEYPIIIKECFSFGLKEIVRKLRQYNFIDTNWSSLDDGLLSSFIARDIYMGKKNKNNTDNTEMISIVEYNYIDCKAMLDVLECIRRLNS
jgi:hypothetical protein